MTTTSLMGIQNSAKSDSLTMGEPLPQDLLKIKEISEKLNLSTRRPSVIQWKQVRSDLGIFDCILFHGALLLVSGVKVV